MEIRNLDGETLATGNSVKDILAEQTSSRRPVRSGRASFVRADLRNLDLSDAKIVASSDVMSTRRSDFKGADFSGSNLQGAELCGLDLRGAKFDGCDMRRGFSLSLCDVRGALFHDCDIGRFTSADRCGYTSQLQRGYWDRVIFTDCDMDGVTFSPNSAEGMVLKGCNLEDANLNGNFDGAFFNGCSLEDANPGKLFPGDTSAARFGVCLHGCNTQDLELDGCPTVPHKIEKSDLPDVSHWLSVWTDDKDQYLVEARQAKDLARQKMMALWEVELMKAQAEQDARAATAKAALNAAIVRERAREATYATRGGAARSESEVASSIAKAVRKAKKAATLSPLTASFDTKPISFEGGIHRIRIVFNRALRVGWRTVLSQGFAVSGGKVTRVRRVNGQSHHWELEIRPSWADDVTVRTTDALVGSGGQSLEVQARVVIKGRLPE